MSSETPTADGPSHLPSHLPSHSPSHLPSHLPLHPRKRPTSAFSSFWMAGFEGADHVDLHGNPLDMVSITGHESQFPSDYARAASLGLNTVRESVGWRICAPTDSRKLSFLRMETAAEAAMTQGVQVLWSLMHYGMPPDIQVTDVDFADRFADFAGAAARRLTQLTGGGGIYNPINEIGFLAWALATQNILGGACSERDGYVVKYKLVQAALRGRDAILAEDPLARFIHVEPLIHVAPPATDTTLAQAAADFCGYQWQVWDMLSGRSAAELGGSPQAVDWIGVNHYHDSQWEIGSGSRLDWHCGDARRRAFSDLLEETWRRYGVPIVVAETSHVGEGRALWLNDIATQTELAIARGVAVDGICLYPAVDRPDWNNQSHWHRSGLWDAIAPGQTEADPPSSISRRLAEQYAAALGQCQKRLPG